MSRYSKLLYVIGISVLLTTVGLFGYANRYNVQDWFILRNYTPTAEIEQLANNTAMSEYGQRLFYVSTPELLDKDVFNASCTHTEETIVLGCYTGRDIYIYNVEKEELSGIKEVTAAHEMLHAAYQRLNAREKERVNALLEAMYKKIQNPRIIKLVAAYQEQDPSIVPNELHSILGTEVELLDQELEAYYQKYFTDRKKVVAYARQYDAVFDGIKNEIDRLYGELNLRKTQISNQEESVEQQLIEITKIKAQMEALERANQIAEYNQLVPQYNAKVNAYNNTIAELKELIDQYNELVNAYNSQTILQKDLINSIDSQYSPAIQQ